MNKSLDWSLFEEYVGRINDLWETEAWQKVNHHDKTNGLSQKAVNSYRREHPGSKLQTAVTTKPSKLKKGSKAAKRRKSFCARMSGNKGPMKKPNGKPTPKALALRRWNCESIEQMAQMIAKGEQLIAEIKKGQKDSNGFTKCWPGKHAEGTKKGKNGKPVRNCVPNESQGVAEGSDSYTVANDPDKPGMHSYREVGHAVQSGHSDAAKIYKNNKFLGTVGDVRKQGVAEGSNNIEVGDKITWWYNKFHPNYEGIVKQLQGPYIIVYAPGSGQMYQLTKDDIRSHKKKGVAEGSLNEFAPDGFNGGDDDEGFSPEIAKMAQEDGFTKGAGLADGATLERAITINHWHSQHGGMYKQYFAKGFKAGRMNKIRHNNKQYNLNLKLMKDGSIRHGEQGVAEGSLEEKWTQKYKNSINCSNPKGFSQKAHCAGKNK